MVNDLGAWPRLIAHKFVLSFTEQKIVPFLIVFLSVISAVKLNQYLFFHFNTSPAIILMPTGIGLAAVYLGGYRMWLPLACAWLIGSLSNPSNTSVIFSITLAIAYPLQAVIGGYVLVRMKFLGTLERTRCALILTGTALLISTVAPTITTGIQWLLGSLSVTAWTSWGRAWAGGVMSIMVLTPLITIWHKHHERKTNKELIESIAAICTLMLAVYLTFWTKLPQVNAFLVLYFLFAVLFWIGLRLHPRMTALALFITTAFGMAGSIIAHPSALPLSQQLLSNELFIILIAPILLILTSLVQERRNALKELTIHVDELGIALNKIRSEDDAKKEFLSVLAHEMRNPLATILSSIELLSMQGAGAASSRSILETIDDRSRAMVRLLDDLLDISRISHKKMTLKKEVVPVDRFIDKIVEIIQPVMRKYGHTLTTTKPDQEIFLDADQGRLEQIFVNLLTNAAKYTKPRGAIDMLVQRSGALAVIHIRDNGMGIPKNMLERIFDPFFQINKNKLGGEGLGVGLPLTRQLVEMHGGTIEATSAGIGAGSEFTVTLPLARPTYELTEETPTATTHSTLGRISRKTKYGLRILLVDDNQAATDALAKLLELRGHAVAIAYSGFEALQKTPLFNPEVVILDIGLPDIDGYEVATRLLNQNKSYYLIALTGYGQIEDKERAKQAGFYHHLTKPAGIKEITAVLRKASLYARSR